MNINVFTSKYQTVLSKEVLSDASMEITVEITSDGKPIKQTAVVSYKEVLARATPDELKEFLTDLMVRDMVRQTEKVALSAAAK
jgi:hypothetical protein